MLQGLAQFRVALLQFLEQPHVLDGDHGLVGEGFEQASICLSENGRTSVRRMVIAPIGSSFAEQRHGENCSSAAAAVVPWTLGTLATPLATSVNHGMDCLSVDDGATHETSRDLSVEALDSQLERHLDP